MNNEVFQFIIDDENSRRIMAQSKKLAAELINRFYIPAHECSLVFAIGSGNERNNQEALIYWVNQSLKTECEIDLGGKGLATYLAQKLEQQLN